MWNVNLDLILSFWRGASSESEPLSEMAPAPAPASTGVRCRGGSPGETQSDADLAGDFPRTCDGAKFIHQQLSPPRRKSRAQTRGEKRDG